MRLGLILAAALALLATASGGAAAPATTKIYLLQGEQAVALTRPGSSLEDTMTALLAGPTAAERAKDVRTQIPAGVPLRSVGQSGNLVTVDLGEKFASGSKAESLSARVAQVVLTLASRPGVKRVRLLVKGGTPLGLFPGYVTRYPLTMADVLGPDQPPPTTPTAPTGPTSEQTRALQQRLADLSYLPESAVDGVAGEQTRFGVLAFQKWQGLGRDGVAGPATMAALAKATRPTPRTSAPGTRVEILLDKQLTLFIRNGVVERTLHVSSGKPGYDTPTGAFAVFRKEQASWSVPYKVWLPWASYFVGGVAFHEYSDVPATPASHGCVRVPRYDAKWLYDNLPNGTRVTVLAHS